MTYSQALALRNASRPRMDCNWIVRQASEARAQLQARRMVAISQIQDRAAYIVAKVEMMVELSNMDYNELNAALQGA